jgi:hypothetical protein
VTELDGAERPRRTVPEGAAANIETVFEQLVGRKPTEPERERLYRLRQVLGLRDNDAFWSIVMALEHYDAFFRAYPAQLAEVTELAVESVRAACAACCACEGRRRAARIARRRSVECVRERCGYSTAVTSSEPAWTTQLVGSHRYSGYAKSDSCPAASTAATETKNAEATGSPSDAGDIET